VIAVFGRLVDGGGLPLAHAEITAGNDIAASDEQGHFLIQTSRGAIITARTRDGQSCTVLLQSVASVEGYANVGDQVCRTSFSPPTASLAAGLSASPTLQLKAVP
jgi:hypothetical protein